MKKLSSHQLIITFIFLLSTCFQLNFNALAQCSFNGVPLCTGRQVCIDGNCVLLPCPPGYEPCNGNTDCCEKEGGPGDDGGDGGTDGSDGGTDGGDGGTDGGDGGSCQVPCGNRCCPPAHVCQNGVCAHDPTLACLLAGGIPCGAAGCCVAGLVCDNGECKQMPQLGGGGGTDGGDGGSGSSNGNGSSNGEDAGSNSNPDAKPAGTAEGSNSGNSSNPCPNGVSNACESGQHGTSWLCNCSNPCGCFKEQFR